MTIARLLFESKRAFYLARVFLLHTFAALLLK